MEEEIAKLLPLLEEDLGDDTQILCSDIFDIMYDINEHEESYFYSNPNDLP